MSERSLRPYKAQLGADSKWYPHGPGGGFGYHSGTLSPHWRFDDKADCEVVTQMLNEAYYAAYRNAQYDMRKALGVSK